MKYSKLSLPETDNHTIVLVTCSNLRHRRFALRFQQEFPNNVIAWFEIRPKKKNIIIRRNYKNIIKVFLKSLLIKSGTYKFYYIARTFAYTIKKKKLLKFNLVVQSALKTLEQKQIPTLYKEFFRTAEKNIFASEVKRLEKYKTLNPIIIENTDNLSFKKRIKSLDPYFFLSLGGSLYKKGILDSIRGICINQHAGHSPEMKGTKTIEWAFYHRRIDYISSTVHITRTGADSGEILRRSQPTLIESDNVGTCFSKVVALGTELMIDAVKEIMSNKVINVYKQPLNIGRTYLSEDFKPYIMESIYYDHNNKWLKNELDRLNKY